MYGVYRGTYNGICQNFSPGLIVGDQDGEMTSEEEPKSATLG